MSFEVSLKVLGFDFSATLTTEYDAHWGFPQFGIAKAGWL
jgi:hypothetical protein